MPGTTVSPRVSICIPTYNGREHLKACLDSIRAQTFPDFEAILCDDQSSDGTLDFAREVTAGDPRFRFVPNPRRFGLVGNWNNCVQVSRAPWIKFVFQDDLIAPTCVEKLLRACEETGKPFGVCEREFLFEPGVPDQVRQWLELHHARLHALYENRASLTADEAAEIATRRFVNNLAGEPNVTLINRSVFENLGGFDESLVQLCDAEFWLRVMTNVGAAIVREPLAVFRIHVRATTAANHGARTFRMDLLDPLVVLHQILLDRRFSRLRTAFATRDRSRFALWRECSLKAYEAREFARASASDDTAKNPATEWAAIVATYPRLRTLAHLGRPLQLLRQIKRRSRSQLA